MAEKYISFAEKPMEASVPMEGGKQEPYYPSITVPSEVFGGVPKVGSKVTLHIETEVQEVRKTAKDIEVRVKVLSGCLAGKNFKKLSPEEQDEEIEKEMSKNTSDEEYED